MQLLTNKTEAIALIKNCPPVRDRFTAEDDAYFDRMLEDSAGILGVTKAYRWRYVAARFLQVNPEVQLLDSAEGAKFTRLDTPIRALLGDQVAEDNYLVSFGYQIPSGMLALDAIYQLPPTNPEGAVSRNRRVPWGSSYISRVSHF